MCISVKLFIKTISFEFFGMRVAAAFKYHRKMLTDKHAPDNSIEKKTVL